MSQKFQVDKTLHGSFLIEEDTVRQLAKSIENAHGKPPETSISFENDRTIKSDSVDDLLSDSIINSTKINQIKMRCHDSEGRSTYVTITNDKYRTINMDIDGNREFVLALEDKFNHIIPARSIFSIFNESSKRKSTLNVTWNILGAISLLATGIFGQLEQKVPLLISLASLTFFIVTAALSGVLGSFLPSVTFNFGAGQKSYRNKTTILKFIGVGIILSLGLGVGGNYLSKLAGI